MEFLTIGLARREVTVARLFFVTTELMSRWRIVSALLLRQCVGIDGGDRRAWQNEDVSSVYKCPW